MKTWLFPGQGSQTPGMGEDLYRQSEDARRIFEEASAVLPDGFLDTLFHGEADAVNDTRVAQPGLLTVEAALAAHLKANGHTPAACAGHSLGEISALVAAEVVTFEDAIRFTVERARLMSEDIPDGGMAAVMGIDPAAIEAALEGADAEIANYNSPQQIIISGTSAAIAKATDILKDAGAKRVMPLKVSGPFHSRHMRPAADAFAAVLKDVPFAAPKFPFISSVSGQAETDPARIKDLLGQQLYSPVRWMQTVAALPDAYALEVGPGSVLKGLAKRIDGAPAVDAAGTLEALDAFAG
jgi:[acyl-carrier-protein] S-malonyltransferase